MGAPTAQALKSALGKAEAAAAVLMDARCHHVDAVPLLYLGWRRALAVLRELQGLPVAEDEPGLSLSEVVVPSVAESDRARLEQHLASLARQYQSMATADPKEAPSRKELLRDAWLLRRVCLLARRRMHTVYGRPRFRFQRTHAVVAGLALVTLSAVAIAAARRAPVQELGWRGQYFKNETLSGEPQVQKDREVAFFWDDGPPIPGFPEDHFSVRWDGCVKLDTGGKAKFSLGSDDGSRLFVNGQRVVDNWGSHVMQWKEGMVELKAGIHHFRVEFMDRVMTGTVLMKMGLNDAPPEVIDTARVLFPGLKADRDKPCGTLQ
jgi:hypothetical protein